MLASDRRQTLQNGAQAEDGVSHFSSTTYGELLYREAGAQREQVLVCCVQPHLSDLCGRPYVN